MNTASLEILSQVAINLDKALLICKADAKNAEIVFANDELIKLVGCSSYEDFLTFTNGKFSKIIYENECQTIKDKISFQIMKNKKIENIKFELKTKNDTPIYTELSGSLQGSIEGPLLYLYFSTYNEKNSSYDFDFVTRLPGAQYFIEQASKIYEDALKQSDNTNYAVLNIYITYLKDYSEHHSESESNKIICEIVECLKKIFDSNLISRISSDNFAIFSLDKRLYVKVNELNDLFNEKFGRSYPIFKAGIKTLTEDESVEHALNCATQVSSLIENSDAIYKYYDQDMEKDQEIYDYVTNNIENAINDEEIEVYYQPVVRTLTGTLCSVEALARWKSKKYGMLQPYKFIEPLEKTHQIYKLDRYIFETICKSLREKIDNNLVYVPVSFNLSRLDFIMMDPFKLVVETTKKYFIPHRLIKIEITESVIMQDPEKMKEILQDFKSEGFEIWMDDFGSAYSSLNMLKEFTLDEIKLDMAFLRNLTDKGKIIIKNVVSMAKELGIQTLCEGVETKENYEFLKSIGCEKTQGYLFSRPLPFDEMIEVINEKKIDIEHTKNKDYFKNLRRVDFQTDTPTIIMRVKDKHFDVYFMNDEALKALADVSLSNMHFFENRLNNEGSMLRTKLLRPGVIPTLNNSSTFVHTYLNQFYKCTIKNIGQDEDDILLLCSFINLSDTTKNINKLNLALQDISKTYASISRVSLRNDTIESIVEDIYNYFDTEKYSSAIDEIKYYVFESDLNRFLEFVNKDNILANFDKVKYSYISSSFKFYDKSRNVYWKNISFVLVSKVDCEVLLLTRNLNKEEENRLNEIENILINNANIDMTFSNQINNLDMFNSIIKNSQGLYYFKDIKHRYIYASNSYLKLFNLSSVEDIKGKTDLDIGFNVTNKKIHYYENKLIREMAPILNIEASSIFLGQNNKNIINLYPIVKSGETIAIFGEIIDLEKKLNSDLIDAQTNLLNARGFMNSFISYYNEYKYHDSKFSIVTINLSSLSEFNKAYGNELDKDIENKVSKMLIDKYGSFSTISHVKYSTFVLILNYMTNEVSDQFVKKLSENIYSINKVNNYSITLYNDIRVVTSDNGVENILKDIINISKDGSF